MIRPYPESIYWGCMKNENDGDVRTTDNVPFS